MALLNLKGFFLGLGGQDGLDLSFLGKQPKKQRETLAVLARAELCFFFFGLSHTGFSRNPFWGPAWCS